MTALAPILLFVYNRPGVTRQTLEALSQNELAAQSTLYVYADGPKPNASPGQLKLIEEVRSIATEKKWCKDVVLIESSENKGLANSVIRGVTEIVNRHGKVIVLEDDIITSKYFLKYLNDGLQVYEHVSNVYAINSYMFPIVSDQVTTFLSPLGTSTWGWATWADRWRAFEEKPRYKEVIQQTPFLRSRFNLGDYNYTDMLDNTNSWGIRWYYSVFVRNGLGVFPTKTLAVNVGFGDDATHTKVVIKQSEVYQGDIKVTLKDSVDLELHSKLVDYFSAPVKKKKQKSLIRKIVARMTGYVQKLKKHIS